MSRGPHAERTCPLPTCHSPAVLALPATLHAWPHGFLLRPGARPRGPRSPTALSACRSAFARWRLRRSVLRRVLPARAPTQSTAGYPRPAARPRMCPPTTCQSRTVVSCPPLPPPPAALEDAGATASAGGRTPQHSDADLQPVPGGVSLPSLACPHVTGTVRLGGHAPLICHGAATSLRGWDTDFPHRGGRVPAELRPALCDLHRARHRTGVPPRRSAPNFLPPDLLGFT